MKQVVTLALSLAVLSVIALGCAHTPQGVSGQPVLVEKSASKKPEWTVKAKDPSESYLYFSGSVSRIPDEKTAIEAAFKNAKGQLIEYFGVSGKTQYKSEKTLDSFQVNDKVELASEVPVHLEQVKIEDQYLEKWRLAEDPPDAYRYEAYVLIRYPKAAFAEEKKRLNKTTAIHREILLQMEIQESLPDQPEPVRSAAPAAIKGLTAAGYRVLQNGEENTDPIAKLYQIKGAAKVVMGGAMSKDSNVQYAQASITYTLTRLADAKVIASDRIANVRGFNENPAEAGLDALSKAGAKLSEALIQTLDKLDY